MSLGVNEVTLLGHLGNDADYRQTPDGHQVSHVSLATNTIWKDKDGNKQQRTEWHRVVFFNRLAEIASEYLKKGMQVYIKGKLRTHSWEKDGIKRWTTEIIAKDMQMLGPSDKNRPDSNPPEKEKEDSTDYEDIGNPNEADDPAMTF